MLNIVIPMAWAWSRFAQAWYTFPKPLIEVKWKPMIQVVVENLKPKDDREYKFTFICQRAHYDKYALKYLLNLIAPNCNIAMTEWVTRWAACTVLLAKEYIDNDDELLLANSDQYIIDWIQDFLNHVDNTETDWSIEIFKSTHPKRSFARLDNDWYVEEVAEKKPISDNATVGIYYFRHWKDFVEWAENMIRKNITTNDEFYVCPVYNELILNDKKIDVFDIGNRMIWIGTPEDLNRFLDSEYSNNI